jgi:hypothetical protein
VYYAKKGGSILSWPALWAVIVWEFCFIATGEIQWITLMGGGYIPPGRLPGNREKVEVESFEKLPRALLVSV